MPQFLFKKLEEVLHHEVLLERVGLLEIKVNSTQRVARGLRIQLDYLGEDGFANVSGDSAARHYLDQLQNLRQPKKPQPRRELLDVVAHELLDRAVLLNLPRLE